MKLEGMHTDKKSEKNTADEIRGKVHQIRNLKTYCR
jgi:hypothetical protein